MKQIEWDIIERKLEGVLSSDEEIRFREWVETSEENKIYFHKLETFYKENGFVKEITEQDVDMSWGKFAEQLKKEKKLLQKFFHISRMTSKVSLKLWKVTLLLSVSWIRLFMSSFLQMKLTSRNLQMLRAKL